MIDRFDGRSADELRYEGNVVDHQSTPMQCSPLPFRRQLACERGLVHNADGSARFQHGNTAVLATVHGPKAASHRDQRHDTAVLEVAWSDRHATDKGDEDKAAAAEKEHFLRHVLRAVVLLDAAPRTMIHVQCNVLFDDGAVLACAVNAACAALIDAGVAMTGVCGTEGCGERGKHAFGN